MSGCFILKHGVDAPTHSTDETLSKFQAQISEFSGMDFSSAISPWMKRWHASVSIT